MPSTSPVRTGILVCTLLGCSKTDGAKSPSDFAEAPHQPSANVSWSAKLFELFAPIAIDVKDSSSLNPQLDREWEDSFTVTNGSQTTNVTTCRSLLDLADGYEPAAPEFEVFQGRKARCRALALVASARPPKDSFVRGFVLDGETPERLPAGFAMSISPDDERRIAYATQRGQRWRDVEDVKLVSQASSDEARYADQTAEQILVILARGDFDGDGCEDVLLLGEGRLPEGSYEGTRVFLVTQTSAESPLTLLQWP